MHACLLAHAKSALIYRFYIPAAATCLRSGLLPFCFTLCWHTCICTHTSIRSLFYQSRHCLLFFSQNAKTRKNPILSSTGWGRIKLTHFHVFSYTSCVDLTPLPSQSSASWRVLRLPLQRQRELSLSAVLVTTASYHIPSLFSRFLSHNSGKTKALP